MEGRRPSCSWRYVDRAARGQGSLPAECLLRTISTITLRSNYLHSKWVSAAAAGTPTWSLPAACTPARCIILRFRHTSQLCFSFTKHGGLDRSGCQSHQPRVAILNANSFESLASFFVSSLLPASSQRQAPKSPNSPSSVFLPVGHTIRETPLLWRPAASSDGQLWTNHWAQCSGDGTTFSSKFRTTRAQCDKRRGYLSPRYTPTACFNMLLPLACLHLTHHHMQSQALSHACYSTLPTPPGSSF